MNRIFMKKMRMCKYEVKDEKIFENLNVSLDMKRFESLTFLLLQA